MIDYKKAADKLTSVLDADELQAIDHGLQRIAPQHNGIIEESKLAGLREKVRAAILSSSPEWKKAAQLRRGMDIVSHQVGAKEEAGSPFSS